jgi:SPP1 family predicted phage head-tail adaptor
VRGQPAGARNKYVIVEQVAESTHDTLGATSKVWTQYRRRWAAVVPNTAREYFASNQVHAEMTHLIEMPYLEGLNSTMRLDLDGRKLNIIQAIDIEEKHVTHRLVCSEITDG